MYWQAMTPLWERAMEKDFLKFRGLKRIPKKPGSARRRKKRSAKGVVYS